MQTAQGFLMNALEAAVETGNRHFYNELGAIIRRRFPHSAREVAQIVNPARFGEPETDEGLAEKNEAKTYVYGQDQPDASVATTPQPKAVEVENNPTSPPAKKKDAAEVAVPLPDGSVKKVGLDELINTEDEDIVSLFGSLKAVKEYLSGALGVDVATNARTGTVVEALKEKLIELYG